MLNALKTFSADLLIPRPPCLSLTLPGDFNAGGVHESARARERDLNAATVRRRLRRRSVRTTHTHTHNRSGQTGPIWDTHTHTHMHRHANGSTRRAGWVNTHTHTHTHSYITILHRHHRNTRNCFPPECKSSGACFSAKNFAESGWLNSISNMSLFSSNVFT